MPPRQRVVLTVLSACLAIALTAGGTTSRRPRRSRRRATRWTAARRGDGGGVARANSSKDEAQPARDNLSSAVAGVKENAGDLSQANVTALKSATDGVKSAVGNVPGDATLADAAAAVKAAGTSMSAAQQIEDGVQC